MASAEPIVAGMAGRYARALFELALEDKSLDRVEADLKQFEAMLEQSEDLQRLVRSPVFSADEQAGAIAAVLAKAGIKGLVANFLGLLAQNRRLFAVRGVIRAFAALMARHRGEVAAEVSSASALSDAQMTALKSSLKASLGQDVQLTTRVDPAILGGLRVKVGSRLIDSSIATQLNNLKLAMREVS